MKRLALMVMIPALVMLTAATVTAGERVGWGAIQGTYSMNAAGSCLHSTGGFDINLKPLPGSVVWGATAMPLGIWTFASDGTGKVSGTNYILDFPPGSPLLGGPMARQAAFSYDITYEVTKDGEITVYPPGPPNLVGMISKDHKIITLSNANQVQAVGPLGSAICNFTRNLIRVDE
jgi:hypothetical protein